MLPSSTASPDPPDPLARVRGRVLLHVRDTAPGLHLRLPTTVGGIVLTSDARRAPPRNQRLYASGHAYPMLHDPARHRSFVATEEEPFRFTPWSIYNRARDPGRALLEMDRWQSPMALLLTPTGFLRGDISGIRALRNAVRLLERVATRRTVLAVPVGADWLSDFGAQTLVTELGPVHTPKALVLDPERVRVDTAERLRALRLVVSEVPDTAVLGAGLVGLDALVHGASFASIDEVTAAGATPPYPGEPFPPATPTWPGILNRTLLAYMAGPTTTVHLPSLGRCECEPCLQWGEARSLGEIGRPFDELGQAAPGEVHAHNLAVWSQLWGEVVRGPWPLTKRWKAVCEAAVHAHDWHNDMAGPRLPPLDPPRELYFMAEEPKR
ncbi:hypothetical protein [Nocardiopsis salina]|uniref:hypothetical protein n=1 Tax=Nocardiopsis salina TaxID=245836 RepID=UPI0012678A6C|nr:hypothetical protein [Nocardiopsis salina]